MAQGAPGVKLTYRDLCQLPEDGLRHELIGGEHFVTAAPSPRHQAILTELLTELNLHFRQTGEGRVFPAPLDIVLTDLEVVEPDLVAFTRPLTLRRAQEAIQDAPDLVVEILSPSTEKRDRGLKRSLYERFGVREYWIVDPDRRTVEVLRLEEGRLEAVAQLGDGDRLTTPLLPGLEIGLAAIFDV